MIACTSLILLCTVVIALCGAHASTPASSSSHEHAAAASIKFTHDDLTAIFGVTQQEWERLAQEKMREQGYHLPPTPMPEAQYMDQWLDHFDSQNNHTFLQRYFVNTQFFDEERPLVFFQIGGEAAATPHPILHANIAYQAREFKAMLVLLEHRFYGDSVPNNDSSTENLKYLTSELALADLVSFRTHIIEQYPQLGNDSQWIVVGGSYPGSLSAWARMKYPHLFLGSISSSAPLQAETDFSQYNEVVARSLGEQCTSQIQAGIVAVTALLSTSPGQAQLVQNFSLCQYFTSSKDIYTFMAILTQPIDMTVQYAWDYRPGVWNMTTLCSIMENESQEPYDNLIDLMRSYRSYFNQTSCVNSNYDSMIMSYRSTTPSDDRSWLWQCCNEFGFFQTGDANDQPFSHLITKEFLLGQCQDVFRIIDMKPHTEDTNRYYGGADIVTSNTIFTQGSLDPWQALGNTQEYLLSGNTQNILINGTGHCRDLQTPEEWDPPQLVAARKAQATMIAFWIEEAKKEAAIITAAVASG